MKFHHRVRTIYVKELTDILRDRRTLIAMIVVPIVLYPLLMLGSIQAVSIQAASMAEERFVVGTVSEPQARLLRDLIDRDARILKRQQQGANGDSAAPGEDPPPEPLADSVDVQWFSSVEALHRAIKNRRCHAGVVFDRNALRRGPGRLLGVTIHVDPEDVRGAYIADRLHEMFERIGRRTVDGRKQHFGLDADFDHPIELSEVDLSEPQSILGQVLPLILILMTITGAIYPAIDLTAGERERGTLESLMVCPVPVIDLIVGKFLVVATVAIMGATLNLGSVAASVWFGGFDKVIASGGGGVPLGKMGLILLCLIPFAVLMSAIMLAVCSYARTFKEAQNYVTPVILAVLIPGGIAALPATRLAGIMLVVPVGNMVLLARDLMLGAAVPLWQIALVLLSTSLYAGAAVAIAANIFGRESVVFADSGSLKGMFSRRLMRPVVRPSPAMGLLLVALLFPLWFFVQSTFNPRQGESAAGLLYATGVLLPIFFVLLPLGMLIYRKVNVAATLALRIPAPRYLLAGVLLGLSAWVPAHELNLLQQFVLPIPTALAEGDAALVAALKEMPLFTMLALIALIPAVCEELLFRGFFLSSLADGMSKWTAIFLSAVVFGVFHFLVFKFAVTAALGVMLAYLCWQSRSIVPGMIAHLLHNAIAATAAVNPSVLSRIGISDQSETAHFPIHVLAIAGFLFLMGLVCCSRSASAEPAATPALTGRTL